MGRSRLIIIIITARILLILIIISIIIIYIISSFWAAPLTTQMNGICLSGKKNAVCYKQPLGIYMNRNRWTSDFLEKKKLPMAKGTSELLSNWLPWQARNQIILSLLLVYELQTMKIELPMLPTGRRFTTLFKTCSNVSKLVQNLFKCVRMCSNLFKTCPNVF